VAAGAGSNDWETIALAFAQAALNVVSLGERACVLSTGSVCTNVHNKAWLPGNAVVELLLSQSQCQDNQLETVWWRYFAVFLDRCQATPLNELWIQGLIHYEMHRQGHGVPARRRAAGELSRFVRQNCVDPATRPSPPGSQRPGRTTHYCMFQGRRLPTTHDHPDALIADHYRMFHGQRIPVQESELHHPIKLHRANAYHGVDC
jgi:hypothetical protein